MTRASFSKLSTIGILAPVLLITGCQSLATTSDIHNSGHSSKSHATLENNQQTLIQQATHIQQALASQNYAAIIDDIHPTRGVRFSMYAYVRPETDKVFSREQYAQYLQQSKIRFTWGEKDGTGDLLITPLSAYLDTWVAANKFNSVTPSSNDLKSHGNMINNIDNIYQKSEVVAFYHKGTEKYAGMDWRALRLVFDKYQGKRYLVAIINDQWTV